MTDAILPEPAVAVPPGGLGIGDAAAAVGLSVDTVRWYEKQGLLLDPTPRTSAGRRRFGDRDLRWLAALVVLRETGMPIADIRVIADLSRRPGTAPELLEEFRRHRSRVLDDLERTRRHLTAIDHKIAAYRAASTGQEPDEDHRPR